MNEKQKCVCGVIIKSHPKSIIKVINSSSHSSGYHDLLCKDNPTMNNKPVTILQVTAVSDTKFIVEFVYEEECKEEFI